MDLSLKNLLVMQDDLRHWDHIQEMADYVRNGGFWTPDYLAQYSKEQNLPRISPIIAISRFEDGKHYLHDGHHRSVATWLGGREYLHPDEFAVSDWVYDDYLEIAPHNGWYTPFDPRSHVRTADFALFKQEARKRFLEDPKEAADWVYEHLDDFRSLRSIKHVPDLASLLKKRLLIA